jgi:hypothetical protein
MNWDGGNVRLNIGPIGLAHEPQWREFWREYLNFYGARVPAEITDHTWRPMLESDSVLGIGASLVRI